MASFSIAVTAKFERSHAVTSRWEGGWSDHPADPGKQTMYGVTQAVYDAWRKTQKLPLQNVRAITRDEALAMFFADYWNVIPCETLADGVDLAVYDAAVNSGVGRARKWLLASLDRGNDHAKTVKAICARRLGFVEALRTWKIFGKGWAARIADIEAKGVAWALAAAHEPVQVRQQLGSEAKKAETAKQAQTKGAAGAGTLGAASGGSALVNGGADPVAGWLLAGGLLLGLVLAAFLVWRLVVNSHRARAYAQAAGER